MLRESIRKELYQNLLTTRFVTCVALSLLLIVIGSLVGSKEYRDRLEEHGGLVAAEAAKRADVRVYSHIKPVLSREPSPLLLFSKGYADRLGTTVTVSHSRVPFLATGGGLDNETLALFPTFDLIEVVRYVLGLLALLLSFDAIAGERETGTLKLVLSNSVSRTGIALAKYLGGLTSLLFPLILGFLVALLLLNIYSPVGLMGQEWFRAASILLCSALYLSAMLLVGLCISALTRNSSTALMLVMLIWLTFVLIVPNLSVFMASEAIELESTRSMGLKVASLENEADELISVHKEKMPDSSPMGELTIYGDEEEVLVRLGRPERYEWLTDYYSFANRTALRYADLIWDVRRNYLYNLSRQASLAYGVSQMSPSFLLDTIAQNLAGSSLKDYEDFMDAARNYRSDVVSYIEERNGFSSRRWFTDDPPDQEPLVLDPESFDRNNMDMERAWGMLAAAKEDKGRRLNLSDMPRFHHYQADVSEAAGRSLNSILMLLGVNVLLSGFYFWAFSRYDVR